MGAIPLGRMGCLGCVGTYAVGFMRCPHCGTRSPMHTGPERKEDAMPKATSGGTSNAWEGGDAVGVAGDGPEGGEVLGFSWEPNDAPAEDAGGDAGDGAVDAAPVEEDPAVTGSDPAPKTRAARGKKTDSAAAATQEAAGES